MDVSDDDDASVSGAIDLFQEPNNFYAPEKPATFVKYVTQSGLNINLRLVGHNPLWGHLLWNAGQVVAKYLEDNASDLVQNKTVLELGAGAGLPSLICAIYGAKKVVVTDYPDVDLIENLRYNISHCNVTSNQNNIVAKGFIWGNDIGTVSSQLEPGSSGFDLLIMADILFNHSEHAKLIQTVKQSLSKSADSRALVFFTPYRPWLLEKDLHFFELAKGSGFVVKKLFEHMMDKTMFPDDPGDESLRRTVFAYDIRWQM